jgi:hypothetical protein
VRSTLSPSRSNRKAPKERFLDLEALVDFANISNEAEALTGFDLKWPRFFPLSAPVSIWTADGWPMPAAPEMPGALVGDRGLIRTKDELIAVKVLDRTRAKWICVDSARSLCQRYLQTLLRGQDADGRALAVLLGLGPPFDENAGRTWLPIVLPAGRPSIDPATREMTWHFECRLQEAVWELMKAPWRVKACPMCADFFVADHQRQVYCSMKCCGENKSQKALARYYETGRAQRQARKVRSAQRGNQQHPRNTIDLTPKALSPRPQKHPRHQY